MIDTRHALELRLRDTFPHLTFSVHPRPIGLLLRVTGRNGTVREIGMPINEDLPPPTFEEIVSYFTATLREHGMDY